LIPNTQVSMKVVRAVAMSDAAIIRLYSGVLPLTTYECEKLSTHYMCGQTHDRYCSWPACL